MINIPIPWTNDVAAYGRQYTVNRKDQFQTRPDGAYASATAKGGTVGSDLPVGSKVKITDINGTNHTFLIVHQGIPDTQIYDVSCDGIWLLRKNVYTSVVWYNQTGNVNYAISNVNTFCNNTFLNLFDQWIKDKIKEVKIPYMENDILHSGSDGLATKAFLPSVVELGVPVDSKNYVPQDGKKLDYFLAGENTESYAFRVATNDNGTAVEWWSRTRWKNSYGIQNNVWCIRDNGSKTNAALTASKNVRPAFILPSNTLFSLEPDADGCYTLIGGVS